MQGEGPGGPDPLPPPPLSDLTLVWDRNSYIDRVVHHFLTGWFFNETRAAFATKLNSGDIQKCNWFWLPFYDLFASARKAVFPGPTKILGSAPAGWPTGLCKTSKKCPSVTAKYWWHRQHVYSFLVSGHMMADISPQCIRRHSYCCSPFGWGMQPRPQISRALFHGFGGGPTSKAMEKRPRDEVVGHANAAIGQLHDDVIFSTTATRILQFFVLSCKLSLLFWNAQRDWQI